MVRRHVAVCRGVAAYAEAQGAQVAREVVLPGAAPGRDESRMDLVVALPAAAQTQQVDVTVVAPTTVEMLRRASAEVQPGAAARAAAAHKRRVYSETKVIPAAVETHGRCGEDFLTFLRGLAPKEGASRTAALQMVYQTIACAVQRGNADAVLSANGG